MQDSLLFGTAERRQELYGAQSQTSASNAMEWEANGSYRDGDPANAFQEQPQTHQALLSSFGNPATVLTAMPGAAQPWVDP